MKERIAEVIINRPSKHLNRTFSYRIPDSLGYMGVGWRCIVSFAGKKEEGVILSLREEETKLFSYKLLDLEGAVDSFPWFTEKMLITAKRLSSYYMCTWIEALRLFLIDKKGIRAETEYVIHWDHIGTEYDIRNYVDASVEVIDEKDAKFLFREKLSSYVKKGALQRKERVQKSHRYPLERWVFPVKPPEEAVRRRSPKQRALWEFLSSEGQMMVSVLRSKGFSDSVIRHFCDLGFGRFVYKPKSTFSLVDNEIDRQDNMLTEGQQRATERIMSAVVEHGYKGILLKGVTGSGKTEVYLRVAERVLDEGGTVLILVPEIALTNQMVEYFSRYFGQKVVFVHSKLNKAERYNNRMRIQTGESSIIIGSRSALFMPFSNLRTIIVDEEYDTSYKQGETPRYNGRDVAKMMAVIYDCPIILGAATPSIATYHAAMEGKIELVEMKERVLGTKLPQIYISDLREERMAGNYGLFSRPLLKLLQKTLQEKKKAILLLNRRGYATTLLCNTCGHVFKCPQCDVSLVYHRDTHRMQCHYCDHFDSMPSSCPKCGSHTLLLLGSGTQKIEDELNERIPYARYERFDLDSTSRKNSANRILNDFREGAFDILLGTQMVAKGHDIPGVQAVGILSVDGSLSLPTYLAAEQTFNLITQSAGRAGRGQEQGDVILQTYNPEHYVVQAAAHHDYETFYKQEIDFRKALGYPPFCKMIKITCHGKKENQVNHRAERIYQWLRKEADSTIFFTPPYDEPIKKVRNTYYVSLLLRSQSFSKLKKKMRETAVFGENGIIIDIDPI